MTTCGSNGSAITVQCDLGCNGSGGSAHDTPECNILSPSNLPASICDQAGSDDLNLATGTMNIDTGSAAQCTMVVSQPSGPKICVIVYGNINVATAATIAPTGTNAFALVATEQMTFAGQLAAAGRGTLGSIPPASPFTPGNGNAPAINHEDGTGGGGGGGGGAVSGAPGGAGSGQAAGAGGVATGNAALVPLIAGAQGAPGTSDQSGFGGTDGGAVELVSCHTATFLQTAVIDVGGAGGGGGAQIFGQGTSGGAGGGGGGGNVLIEASDVTIFGGIFANGGGGGGADDDQASNNFGQNGTQSLGAAQGGDGFGGAEGSGGQGGVASAGPSAGSSGTVAGGGGGGAVGRVRVNVRSGTSATITGTISASFTTGTAAVHTN